MDIKEVKRNLGKTVVFGGKDYIFTACVLRRSNAGELFYQAELQDTKQNNSVLIAKLSEVGAIV